MNRRTILVGAGLSVTSATAALGGCLDEQAADDASPGADTDGDDGGESADDGEDDGTDGDDDEDDENEVEEAIEEDPRVTEPSHGIERPDPPEDPDDPDDPDDPFDPEDNDWNEEYLGDQMATEPSLEFERLLTPAVTIRNTVFSTDAKPSGEVYRVRLIGDEDEYESVFDDADADDETRDRLRAVDFDESVLVLVESGFGSGSVDHRWARIENDDGIAQLHGYYTDPYVRTADLTSRHSVLEVERPSDGLEFARVSLTVGENRRIHFNSTEGIVTLEE
ncbi:hypothetical protein [Natronorubrum tibetense]|uniref:Lipoprotein n=1 Tax=Natronorubrum tibetense GA33 TaxID=1114856 RepID=L9VVF7_9EURY|nr:hypothetical protein [Natronorubrum tibetense]ELY40991.1 hypothetical protein C496_09856 [Natronorubrum tibetense GA33]